MISRSSIPELLKVIVKIRLLVSDQKVEKMRTLKLELKTRETTTLQKPSAKTRHRKVLREK